MSSIQLAGFGELVQNQASIDFPRPDRLVTENPERLTYSLYEHPHMGCGIWQCEVGAWNIQFADNKQEFFQVIEGVVRLVIERRCNDDRIFWIDVIFYPSVDSVVIVFDGI